MWTEIWTFLAPSPLCSYMDIWQPPSPCHVHMVYFMNAPSQFRVQPNNSSIFLSCWFNPTCEMIFFSNFACVFCFLGKFVEFEYNFGWKHREVTLFLVLFAKKVSKSFRQIDPCWRSGWCLHTSAWWLQMLKLTNSDYLRNANWPVNHAPYHYNRTLLFLSTLQGLFLFFIVFFFKIWWFCVFLKAILIPVIYFVSNFQVQLSYMYAICLMSIPKRFYRYQKSWGYVHAFMY